METRNVQVVKRYDNFPVDGQDYCLGQDHAGRWFFAWGYQWPKMGRVPALDVEEGNNGIHWHATLDEAERDLRQAMDLFDADDGGYNPVTENNVYWPYY